MIHAFVLAGGRGTRLAPLTTIIPKPLVPVGDRSILEILVRQLTAAGADRITISLGYLGHLIKAVIGDTQDGLEVRYTEETEPLGTAGALGMLDDVDDADDVLVVNGDTLTDLSFRQLVDDHQASGADATIAAHRREHRVEYGVLRAGPDGELLAYDEKPTESFLVSMGINVLRGSVLRRVRPLRRCDMPELLLELVADGKSVRCFESPCFWLDLGRIDDVRSAQLMLAEDVARFLPG